MIANNLQLPLIELVNFLDKRSSRPTLVVRPELFAHEIERESTWSFARRVAYLRPASFLRTLLDADHLAASLCGHDRSQVMAWCRAADVRSHRAAFLLCDDLQVAQRMIASDLQLPESISARDQLADVVSFSLSAPYAALRAATGLAIV